MSCYLCWKGSWHTKKGAATFAKRAANTTKKEAATFPKRAANTTKEKSCYLCWKGSWHHSKKSCYLCSKGSRRKGHFVGTGVKLDFKLCLLLNGKKCVCMTPSWLIVIYNNCITLMDVFKYECSNFTSNKWYIIVFKPHAAKTSTAEANDVWHWKLA